jgi:hypothetical protein
MAINHPKRKGGNLRLKMAENLRRRKETLFKKVFRLGEYVGVDVALIIRQNGRFFTYRSIDHESLVYYFLGISCEYSRSRAGSGEKVSLKIYL